MSKSINLEIAELAFQKSPIILVNGIASNMPGKMMPLIAVTQGASFNLSSGFGALNTKLDEFFMDFSVVPGGTLHDNNSAKYPMANLRTAANAIIGQPLHISLKMRCYPRLQASLTSRMAISALMQSILEFHNFNGGSYIILTPMYIYKNCLMMKMVDISSGGDSLEKTQSEWQLDFEQPLITQQSANMAYNSLMSNLAAGAEMTTPTWSGLSAVTGILDNPMLPIATQ